MSEHLSPLNKGIGGGSHKLDAGNGESRTSALLRAAAMASTASSGSNTTSSRSAPNVAMASSMTAARSNASSLLDSSLTPEQKLYVAAHMGAMDPFRGNSASTLLNAEQQQHLDNLSALIAQQQRIEEARHALKIDALRARAAATVAASARLQGLGGGLGLQGVAGNQQAYLARLMKESPSMLFPTDFSNLSMPYSGQASLPQTNTVASLLRPSTQMESQPMSLPLPPDSKKKGRGGTFPMKLHQMLADLERQKGGTEIASFLPHGRAFAIHKVSLVA